MPEDQIHVNPDSVIAYGRASTEIFQGIKSELEGLASDIVSVTYYGENAVKFKTDAGELATRWANAITKDLTTITEAVADSTSRIAAACGNQVVRIEFSGGTISPPAVPAGDGTFGAVIPALEGLKGTVSQRTAQMSEMISDHLSRLTQTDWRGNAKTNAVDAVTRFTSDAKLKVDEMRTELNGFIDKQIEALRRGDQ